MSANDRQEGGDHYRQAEGKPQHWDLAIIYGWDPFQYQITKYVMRWKTKHKTPAARLEDLKKARHFLDKYIENAEAYDRATLPAPAAPNIGSNDRWVVAGWLADCQQYECRTCRLIMKAQTTPGDTACPKCHPTS